jgi:hypothetical protein
VSDGWVTGDRVGISFPAHPDALRDGGVAFLTKAFHTSGVLDSASAVVRIDRCEEVSGGAVDHYRAMLTAVARLAGTHRAGRLPDRLTDQFPVDLRAATVGEPPPLTPDKLHRRLTRLAEWAEAHPRLLPANVRSPEFGARVVEEAQEVMRRETAIWRYLADAHDYIALCHWNANVDNAWFFSDGADDLRCGLMDWGCVSQMNVAMAIWMPCQVPKPTCGTTISTNLRSCSAQRCTHRAVRGWIQRSWTDT